MAGESNPADICTIKVAIIWLAETVLYSVSVKDVGWPYSVKGKVMLPFWEQAY
jgi:hypothetical protein